MEIDQKMASEYVQKLAAQMKTDPNAVGKMERRALTKAAESKERMNNMTQEIRQLRDTVTQAEARLKSLELQLENEVGKHNGMLDLIVSLKFEADAPTPPPGNGSKPPEPVKPPEATPNNDKTPKAAADAD